MQTAKLFDAAVKSMPDLPSAAKAFPFEPLKLGLRKPIKRPRFQSAVLGPKPISRDLRCLRLHAGPEVKAVCVVGDDAFAEIMKAAVVVGSSDPREISTGVSSEDCTRSTNGILSAELVKVRIVGAFCPLGKHKVNMRIGHSVDRLFSNSRKAHVSPSNKIYAAVLGSHKVLAELFDALQKRHNILNQQQQNLCTLIAKLKS